MCYTIKIDFTELCMIILYFGWLCCFQGSVLSAFFWGYTLTQVLGGYLSDRYGAQRVLLLAGIGWALLTFSTPVIIYTFVDSSFLLYIVVFSRILVGSFQGKDLLVLLLCLCKTV